MQENSKDFYSKSEVEEMLRRTEKMNMILKLLKNMTAIDELRKQVELLLAIKGVIISLLIPILF